MSKKPIIGIISKYNETKDERYEALISDEIKNAIIDNGGIPIGILTTETKINFFRSEEKFDVEKTLTKKQQQDLIAQLNLCDGIILQGGLISLQYECWIAKYTYDHDIPTLGFCAGQNNMIRALGGTTKKIPNPEKHNQEWKEEVHDIYIDKNSQFYKIVKCEKMSVNSRHNKTIDNPTDKYKIAAVCDDGYPDVLEAPNKKFNMAIRFHPESLYKKYPKHNAIFKAFLSACKNSH